MHVQGAAVSFANDPNLANIRDDPSFITFMRELKAQWERYRATW